jgi:hypothetical protein
LERFMSAQQWARLRADSSYPLRQGAWYPVISVSALEAVLDVQKSPVLVPRLYLDIVQQRPTRWSVITTPARSPRVPGELGQRYGVCPSCRERMPLSATSKSQRCRRCNGVFDIAWESGSSATG